MAEVTLGVWAGDGDNFHFLDPILEKLPEYGYRVKKFSWSPRTPAETLMRQIESVDMVWFEWCNGPVFAGSRMVGDKPAVCRLHRYEAYQAYPRQVDWRGIDRLILISPYVGEILDALHPGIVPKEKRVFIPNGVNTEAIPFRSTTERQYTVGWIGRIHYVKNPMLALQILASLVAEDERYVLHMVGSPQHYEVLDYLRHMVRVMGLERHFQYHREMPQRELYAWMQQMDVVLSTSVIESQGMAIQEAMATGARPVVHDFPGAGYIYPETYRYRTVAEAVQQIMAGPEAPDVYRRFVEARFGFDQQMASIVQLLDTLRESVTTARMEPSNAWEEQIAHFIEAGQLKEAEEVLVRQQSLSDKDVREQMKMHVWGIRLGIAAGDYTYALLHAERALEQEEKDPAVYFWMGEALWKTGHPEGAAEAWVYAAELLERGVSSVTDLDTSGVYATAAEICKKLGQEEAAVRFEVLAHMA